MQDKKCVLEERECNNCCECTRCDLEPDKFCDNCCNCIDFTDVASIKIDKIISG